MEWPNLKRIARTPELPRWDAAQPATLQSGRDPRTSIWSVPSVKNVVGMGEVPSSRLPGEARILVLDVPQANSAAAAGLRQGDVVLRLDGKPADALRDLQRLSAESPAFGTVNITIWRAQREITLAADAPGTSARILAGRVVQHEPSCDAHCLGHTGIDGGMYNIRVMQIMMVNWASPGQRAAGSALFPDLFPVCSQSRPMNSWCSRCSGLLPRPMWTSCPRYCHIFNH